MSGRHRRCVSDSSRYIRSRAQYAAIRLALVKVDLPKGTGGLTGHQHASLSHDGAARTGGWRRPLLRSVYGRCKGDMVRAAQASPDSVLVLVSLDVRSINTKLVTLMSH